MATSVDPGPGSDHGKPAKAASAGAPLEAPARAFRGITVPESGYFRRSCGIRQELVVLAGKPLANLQEGRGSTNQKKPRWSSTPFSFLRAAPMPCLERA